MAKVICTTLTCVGAAAVFCGLAILFDWPIFAEITCYQHPQTLEEFCQETSR